MSGDDGEAACSATAAVGPLGAAAAASGGVIPTAAPPASASVTGGTIGAPRLYSFESERGETVTFVPCPLDRIPAAARAELPVAEAGGGGAANGEDSCWGREELEEEESASPSPIPGRVVKLVRAKETRLMPPRLLLLLLPPLPPPPPPLPPPPESEAEAEPGGEKEGEGEERRTPPAGEDPVQNVAGRRRREGQDEPEGRAGDEGRARGHEAAVAQLAQQPRLAQDGVHGAVREGVEVDYLDRDALCFLFASLLLFAVFIFRSSSGRSSSGRSSVHHHSRGVDDRRHPPPDDLLKLVRLGVRRQRGRFLVVV